MLRGSSLCPTLLIALTGLFVAGCPEAGLVLPGLNTVRVELVNDTGFPVDPDIRYDDDAGFWAGLVPAETLSTGLLGPGETAVYRFDCDELGLIRCDQAEQIIAWIGDYAAETSPTLERDDEYGCGDLVRFRFVGYGEDFGVIVSVNGQIVD